MSATKKTLSPNRYRPVLSTALAAAALGYFLLGEGSSAGTTAQADAPREDSSTLVYLLGALAFTFVVVARPRRV